MINLQIDKLTNSIENAVTGERFETAARLLFKQDISKQKKAFGFNWDKEIEIPGREVYGLYTLENPEIIHGLISVEKKPGLVFMHLIENSRFNKGKTKQYQGVAGNLVAFACKLSFESDYDGFVSFESKNSLISHYQKTLKAKVLFGNMMVIETPEALELVRQYFKGF